MNTAAETVVKRDRNVAGPRLPKKVWDEPAPPKAAPMDWPFPTCSRTTRIRVRDTITCTITNNTCNSLLPPVHKNLGKRSGIQTGAANEGAVNIGLGHQRSNVLRSHTATVLDTHRVRDGLTPYLREQRAQETMHLLSLARRRSHASTNRPQGLIGQHDLRHSGTLTGCQTMPHLPLQHGKRFPGLPLCQGFANTDYGTQTSLECGGGLFCHRYICLPEILPTL